MFKTIQHIHFVGIGGSGMSGIAEVLITLGYKVSGSDLKKTDMTQRLEKLGAKVYYGHASRNIGDAHVVVTSTAVNPDNPEVVFARKNNIPVIPRIEMLSELARLKYTIAVAGTHGKTTTTSMVASIFQSANLDPTFIIGGKLLHLQSGAKLGHGEFLIAEADESDGSFLKLSPTVSLITNIDNDHLDYYKSEKNLRSAFVQFANRVPFYGCAIVCAEDKGVNSVLPLLNRKVITYGFNFKADYNAQDIYPHSEGTTFVLFHKQKSVGTVFLKLSGNHNVLNALAACACGMELNISFEKIVYALKNFESVARRLEKKGEKNGAVWIDDYGHHPTEIKAVLAALRDKFPKKKIIALFQPHRYTRTKILLKEFGEAFTDADEVILMPIYSAGEKPVPGVSSKNIYDILKRKGVNASMEKVLGLHALKSRLRPDTIFLTLGAGDVWKTGEKIFAE